MDFKRKETLDALTGARRRAKALIKEAGLSQAEFCEKTGLSKSQYYRYLSPKREDAGASQYQFVNACLIMNWSPNYLLFGIGPPKLSHAKGEPDAVMIAVENNQLLKELHTSLLANRIRYK